MRNPNDRDRWTVFEAGPAPASSGTDTSESDLEADVDDCLSFDFYISCRIDVETYLIIEAVCLMEITERLFPYIQCMYWDQIK
jgi:hypothetical protein